MSRRRLSQSAGFTLLEMIVVLVLLAAVATIAVQSVDGRADQTRYEATQTQMQNIQDAVIGPLNQRSPDGALSVSGFVNDVGRLPQVLPVLKADGSTQVLLSDNVTPVCGPVELWSDPATSPTIPKPILAPFAFVQAIEPAVAKVDVDSDISVPCGWRGPYIRLSVGQTDPRDGWGNPFDFLQSNRVVCNGVFNDPANMINIIRSNGANGGAPPNNGYDNVVTTGYDPDLYINFNTNPFNGATGTINYPSVSASNQYQGTLSGKIYAVDTSAGGNGASINPAPTGADVIYVRFFCPNPAGGGILVMTVPDKSSTPSVSGNEQTYSKTSLSGNIIFSVTTNTLTKVVSYMVQNAPIGTRTLRAYLGPVPDPAIGTTSITSKSIPTTVVITPGGLQKDLIVR